MTKNPNANQPNVPTAEPVPPVPSDLLSDALGELLLLPFAPTDEVQCNAYRKALQRMLHKIGPERFQAVIERAIDECKTFPVPAELWEKVEQPAVTCNAPRLERKPGEEYFGLADLMRSPAFQKILERK